MARKKKRSRRQLGEVRHDQKKMYRAVKRDRRWAPRTVRFAARVMRVTTPDDKVAHFDTIVCVVQRERHRLPYGQTPIGRRKQRCAGGSGKTPTKATQAALRALIPRLAH